MVKKIIRIGYIMLMAVLAILLCINSVLLLNSGHKRMQFTVTYVYTNHKTNINEVSLQAATDNTLIIPSNKLVTNKNYAVGEQVVVWYHPEHNVLVQNFMQRIVMQLAGAGMAICCAGLALPRQRGKCASQKDAV